VEFNLLFLIVHTYPVVQHKNSVRHSHALHTFVRIKWATNEMKTLTVLLYSAQVVAGPFQDRLSIAVAKELQTAFGGWKEPPSSENNV